MASDKKASRKKFLLENMDAVDRAAEVTAMAYGMDPKLLRYGPDYTPNFPGKGTGSGPYASFAQQFVRDRARGNKIASIKRKAPYGR